MSSVELLWRWGNGSAVLRAVSEAGWGELQLWALVSSEKLIKSETAAGGKIGGRAAEGLKERRSMREREREREPLGVGLLEDQDYYCYHHCLISPPLLPAPVLLISSTSPSSLTLWFWLPVTHLLLSHPSFPPSSFSLHSSLLWPSEWGQAASRRVL